MYLYVNSNLASAYIAELKPASDNVLHSILGKLSTYDTEKAFKHMLTEKRSASSP